ncbi:hypothetical protein PPYR_15066 [Photinus pyralis]|uniref:RNA-directed DNA polymerase n=1 Tax=Photinus pyralis TaxID=7054 RepID=A0A5N3ZZP3_PHOPY|nr:hypothetical protein PPYR_15066 [Photinus pyralis]
MWTDKERSDFQKLKRLLTEKPVLKYYDVNKDVILYKSGRELLLADALSRSYLKDDLGMKEIEDEIYVHVSMIVENLSFSNDKIELFRQETKSDTDLQTVMTYIQHGWPKYDKIPNQLKFYYSIRDTLFVINDLLFRNETVVVPKSLRSKMLKLIHCSHFGIEKCKLRAKSVLFWPHMFKEIEDVVKNCSSCLKYQRKHGHEKLLLRDIPNRPWEIVGVDLFYFQNKTFVLVIDYYSKYVDFKELRAETTENVIVALKSVFSLFGKPKIIYSDGGPQFFRSFKFKDFIREWGLQHQTSSPYYARSNGMVERYVQTIKNMLKKSVDSGLDPYIALIEYRNTPISSEINKSPSELVFGHKINAFLPTTEDFFLTNEQSIRDKLKHSQEKYKYFHDSKNNVKPLSFEKGEIVHIRDKVHNMTPVKVIGPADRPRSYQVQLPSGNIVDRNRHNMYKASTQFRVDEPVTLMQNSEQVQNPEKTENSNNQESRQELSSLIKPEVSCKTRTGRVVKKPQYLSDYVVE